MVAWWESRTIQLRTDCIIMNGDTQMNPSNANRTCLDLPPATGEGAMDMPYCYTMDDGWDAMEGSVSGDGCRPTIGAMMWSEALAIATVANSTGVNGSLAEKFAQRAEWIKGWYLEKLWSDDAEFLAVYKQGAEFTGMGGCTDNTRKNMTDSGCCCIKAGTRVRTGHYENFTECPAQWVYDFPRSPGNVSQCKSIGPVRSRLQSTSVACDSAFTGHPRLPLVTPQRSLSDRLRRIDRALPRRRAPSRAPPVAEICTLRCTRVTSPSPSASETPPTISCVCFFH